MIVLDIDRFSASTRHTAGDEVLRTLRTCRLEFRPGDQIGRNGGEFLVVLHVATRSQACDIAECLRAAVECLDFSSIAPTSQSPSASASTPRASTTCRGGRAVVPGEGGWAESGGRVGNSALPSLLY